MTHRGDVVSDAVGFGGESLQNRLGERSDRLCSHGGVVAERDATQPFQLGDAPSQSCVYIPPGDHRHESYRLGTFGKFPAEVQVSPSKLTAAGFYYTGYKDKVKCFSCGISLQNCFLPGNAPSRKWHHPFCEMANGHDSSDVPRPQPDTVSVAINNALQRSHEVNAALTTSNLQDNREVVAEDREARVLGQDEETSMANASDAQGNDSRSGTPRVQRYRLRRHSENASTSANPAKKQRRF